MLTYDHNLSMGDIPEGWILNVYISQKVILVLLKDEDRGEFLVASFNIDDKHCTNALSRRELKGAQADFKDFISADLAFADPIPANKYFPEIKIKKYFIPEKNEEIPYMRMPIEYEKWRARG